MKAKKTTAELLRVRVTPDAKQEYVKEGKGGVLEIAVKEPAEENRANIRVVTLVASHLKVPVKAVRLVRGHHARVKMVEWYANKS